MSPAIIALLLSAGLGGALLLSHPSGSPSKAPGAAPKGPAPLSRGKWYKVTLHASSPASTTPIKDSLGGQGFFVPALLVSGPADASAIGFFMGASATMLTAPSPWSVTAVEEVNAPPQSTQAQLTPPVLDPNLPVPTAVAVATALTTETEAAALSAFSSALLPDYPAAAAILKTRAAILSLPAGTSAPTDMTSTSGLLGDIGHFVGDVGHVASNIVHDVGQAAKVVGKVATAVKDVAVPVLAAAAPYVESIVAVVPGIGTAASSALALGTALAQGKSVAEAGLEAAAASVPGGDLALGAAKSAMKIASDIGSGKQSPASGGAALEQIHAAAPGVAQAAILRAAALAHAQALQKEGFLGAKDLLPGDSAAQSIAFSAALSKNPGANIATVLEGQLRAELSKIPGSATHVHATVASLVARPELAQLTSLALAKAVGQPEPIARAALASVSVPPTAPLTKDMILVKTARMVRIMPGAPLPAQPKASTVKLVTKIGAEAALAGAFVQESRGNVAKARDLAHSALVVQRREFVSKYLSPT